jgi:hypothetical protein
VNVGVRNTFICGGTFSAVLIQLQVAREFGGAQHREDKENVRSLSHCAFFVCVFEAHAKALDDRAVLSKGLVVRSHEKMPTFSN